MREMYSKWRLFCRGLVCSWIKDLFCVLAKPRGTTLQYSMQLFDSLLELLKKKDISWFYDKFHFQNSPAIRLLRSSPAARGLEEFFPPGCLEKGELAPETVKTGEKINRNVLPTQLIKQPHYLLQHAKTFQALSGRRSRRSGLRTG